MANFELKPQGLLPPGVFSIYGPPGGTKTSVALTFPKPMVYFDFDKGVHRGWGAKLVDGKLLYFGDPKAVELHRPTVPARSITTRQVKLEGWRKAWSD